MRTIRVILTAVAVPVLLSACGGGSGDSNINVPLAGGPAAPTGDGGGFTTSGKTFFNEDDGIKFADALGGSFADVFGAITGGLDQGTTASNAPADTSIAQRMKRATQTENIACSTSGAISNSVTTNDATGEPTAATISFNDCVNGSSRSNGSISFTVSGTEPNQTVSLSFNNFNSVDAGETSSINGSINISVSDTGASSTTTISGSSISMASAGETVVLSNYSLTSTDDSTGASSLEGRSTITTAAGWSHSDGSTLRINADSGDATTFDYVISDGNSTTSGVGKWSETDIGEITL